MSDNPIDSSFAENAGSPRTRVKIIGVGGGGVNTVERLMAGGLISAETAQNAEFAAVNTDAQSLESSPVPERLVIGRSLTRGLGAGGEAERGRAAAEADRPAIESLVRGVDLVVLLVALGGGTGSGAAPVIAAAAGEAGAMVIAFVTLPFSWEGERRTRQSHEAIDRLRSVCEAVIPLHNDMLLQGDGADAPVEAAFDRANSWICAGLNSLCGMLFKPGLINIDFATLRSALAEAEQALHAAEEASGKPAPELQRHNKSGVDDALRALKTEVAFARADLRKLERDDAASSEALDAARTRLAAAEQALAAHQG